MSNSFGAVTSAQRVLFLRLLDSLQASDLPMPAVLQSATSSGETTRDQFLAFLIDGLLMPSDRDRKLEQLKCARAIRRLASSAAGFAQPIAQFFDKPVKVSSTAGKRSSVDAVVGEIPAAAAIAQRCPTAAVVEFCRGEASGGGGLSDVGLAFLATVIKHQSGQAVARTGTTVADAAKTLVSLWPADKEGATDRGARVGDTILAVFGAAMSTIDSSEAVAIATASLPIATSAYEEVLAPELSSATLPRRRRAIAVISICLKQIRQHGAANSGIAFDDVQTCVWGALMRTLTSAVVDSPDDFSASRPGSAMRPPSSTAAARGGTAAGSQSALSTPAPLRPASSAKRPASGSSQLRPASASGKAPPASLAAVALTPAYLTMQAALTDAAATSCGDLMGILRQDAKNGVSWLPSPSLLAEFQRATVECMDRAAAYTTSSRLGGGRLGGGSSSSEDREFIKVAFRIQLIAIFALHGELIDAASLMSTAKSLERGSGVQKEDDDGVDGVQSLLDGEVTFILGCCFTRSEAEDSPFVALNPQLQDLVLVKESYRTRAPDLDGADALLAEADAADEDADVAAPAPQVYSDVVGALAAVVETVFQASQRHISAIFAFPPPADTSVAFATEYKASLKESFAAEVVRSMPCLVPQLTSWLASLVDEVSAPAVAEDETSSSSCVLAAARVSALASRIAWHCSTVADAFISEEGAGNAMLLPDPLLSYFDDEIDSAAHIALTERMLAMGLAALDTLDAASSAAATDTKLLDDVVTSIARFVTHVGAYIDFDTASWDEDSDDDEEETQAADAEADGVLDAETLKKLEKRSADAARISTVLLFLKKAVQRVATAPTTSNNYDKTVSGTTTAALRKSGGGVKAYHVDPLEAQSAANALEAAAANVTAKSDGPAVSSTRASAGIDGTAFLPPTAAALDVAVASALYSFGSQQRLPLCMFLQWLPVAGLGSLTTGSSTSQSTVASITVDGVIKGLMDDTSFGRGTPFASAFATAVLATEGPLVPDDVVADVVIKLREVASDGSRSFNDRVPAVAAVSAIAEATMRVPRDDRVPPPMPLTWWLDTLVMPLMTTMEHAPMRHHLVSRLLPCVPWTSQAVLPPRLKQLFAALSAHVCCPTTGAGCLVLLQQILASYVSRIVLSSQPQWLSALMPEVNKKTAAASSVGTRPLAALHITAIARTILEALAPRFASLTEAAKQDESCNLALVSFGPVLTAFVVLAQPAVAEDHQLKGLFTIALPLQLCFSAGRASTAAQKALDAVLLTAEGLQPDVANHAMGIRRRWLPIAEADSKTVTAEVESFDSLRMSFALLARLFNAACQSDAPTTVKATCTAVYRTALSEPKAFQAPLMALALTSDLTSLAKELSPDLVHAAESVVQKAVATRSVGLLCALSNNESNTKGGTVATSAILAVIDSLASIAGDEDLETAPVPAGASEASLAIIALALRQRCLPEALASTVAERVLSCINSWMMSVESAAISAEIEEVDSLAAKYASVQIAPPNPDANESQVDAMAKPLRNAGIVSTEDAKGNNPIVRGIWSVLKCVGNNSTRLAASLNLLQAAAGVLPASHTVSMQLRRWVSSDRPFALAVGGFALNVSQSPIGAEWQYAVDRQPSGIRETLAKLGGD